MKTSFILSPLYLIYFVIFVIFLATEISCQSFVPYLINNAAARNATCNDGTPGVYALKNATTNPNLWLIYLEGGYFCNTLSSCTTRNTSQHILMTSNGWGAGSQQNGLLSTNSTLNPDFSGGNIVYAHYCSSDFWIGKNGVLGPWVFNGRQIVKALFEDLIQFRGLVNGPSTKVLFGGGSAGGVGAVTNIEFVASTILTNVGQLWGLCDSGFFFNTSSINPVNPFYTIGQVAWPYWNPDISSMNCSNYYQSTPYYCFSAPIALPYIEIPMFVHVSLYDDSAVTLYGSVSPPNSNSTLAFDIAFGITTQNLLCTTAAKHSYFSASCCLHQIAFRTDAFNMLINNISMYDTITDWFFQRNQLSHQVVEPPSCYCFRGYDCNPTCSCDHGPGYQYNNCTPPTCSGTGSTTSSSITSSITSTMTTNSFSTTQNQAPSTSGGTYSQGTSILLTSFLLLVLTFFFVI